MSRKSQFFALAALVFPASVASAQIYVPADQPTLQEAINASPSGGTIIVTTSAEQQPVTVDRAVNIIGDPVCNITNFCMGAGVTVVNLSGPGSGTVRLSNVQIYSSVDCADYDPMIAGSGFDALHLYDSSVYAPFGGLTGYGQSGPAIATSLPFLLLSGCTVRGGSDGIDDCPLGTWGPPPYVAYPAITGGQSVLSLDSNVRGGSVIDLCCVVCACPGDISFLGGEGAVAIEAEEVWVSGGSVTGGIGTSVFADGVLCGSAPDGLAISAQALRLPTGFLVGSGTPKLGTTWSVNYLADGSSVLNFGLNVNAPILDGAAGGYSFMGTSFLTLLAIPPGSAGTFPLPVPNNAALLGFEVVFQLVDMGSGWSRPVAGVIVP